MYRITINQVNITYVASHSFLVAQWLVRSAGTRKLVRSTTPAGRKIFSLSHCREKVKQFASHMSELSVYYLSLFNIVLVIFCDIDDNETNSVPHANNPRHC